MAVSATCAIVAARRDDRPGFYLFKPLTTFIILVGAAWLIRPAPPPYRALIVVGLACSLGGDVLLMLPGRMAGGVAAFLGAQLAYIAAFSLGSPVTLPQLPWLLPFVAFGGAVVADRWRALGKLRIPFVVYALAVGAMAWRAAMRGQTPLIPRQTFLCAAVGAGLFLVSDAVVALRRFGRSFPAAQPVELSTYWAAQFLIALSVQSTIG